MDVTETGPLYTQIGRALADMFHGNPDGAFLYAEVEPGVLAASVFLDIGDRVVHRFSNDALTNLLFEAWNAVEAGKRWATMSYTIAGNKFSAKFQFHEELDPNEDQDDRHDRIVREKYGDKPIEYSDP